MLEPQHREWDEGLDGVDDNSIVAPHALLLGDLDREFLCAARDLAWKMVRATCLRQPHELVGLARAIYALSRVPQLTDDVTVTFGVMTPVEQNQFMELRRSWEVCVSFDGIELNSGGTINIGNGTDSFRQLSWYAGPCSEPIRDEFGEIRQVLLLGALPKELPLVAPWPQELAAIDLSTGYYEIYVADDSGDMDMELLDWDEIDPGDEEDLSEESPSAADV